MNMNDVLGDSLKKKTFRDDCARGLSSMGYVLTVTSLP